jgi:hypothetical protein
MTGSFGIFRSPILRIVDMLVAVIIALLVIFFLVGPFRATLLMQVDDIYFYFEIARRLGSGQGSTFDGINQTNGYHPLWLIVLLVLTPLMNASRELGARMACVLSVLLFSGTLYLLRKTALRISPVAAAMAMLYTWSALMFSSIYGMESMLAAMLLAATLWFLSRTDMLCSSRSGPILGILSGFLVLSRLDSALYVIALDGLWTYYLIRSPQSSDVPGRWTAWGQCVAIQVAFIGTYLAVNYISFGHLLTISAMTKAGRTRHINHAWLHGGLPLVSLFNIMLSVIALWLHKPNSSRLTLTVAAVGTWLTMLQIFLLGGKETTAWYFTLPVLCGGYFVASIIGALSKSMTQSKMAVRVCVAVCIIFMVFAVHGKFRDDGLSKYYDYAKWIAAYVPPSAVFADSDCGLVGYFSLHPFMNTDGLTNSFEFAKALHEDRVPEWLMQHGCNSMVMRASSPPLKTCDGRHVADFSFYPDIYGESKYAYAEVVPVPINLANPRFQLWHIVAIKNGRTAEIDACTASTKREFTGQRQGVGPPERKGHE